MNNSFVVTAIDSAVMYITVNRQDKLNAVNKAVLGELHTAFENACNSDDINCVVLTGAGQKAFVAGADILEIQSLDNEGVTQLVRQGHELMALIENLGKPVIAAINGFALGAGCELALACSLRIAASSARIGLPEIQLGLMPGYGGTQRMSRLIGRGRALEMMLSGQAIDAERAKAWGLVNVVAEPEALAETVKQYASRLAASAPCAMKGILEAVHRGSDLELGLGMDVEADQFIGLFDTHDMREGTSAFLEKRKPDFKGN